MFGVYEGRGCPRDRSGLLLIREGRTVSAPGCFDAGWTGCDQLDPGRSEPPGAGKGATDGRSSTRGATSPALKPPPSVRKAARGGVVKMPVGIEVYGIGIDRSAGQDRG